MEQNKSRRVINLQPKIDLKKVVKDYFEDKKLSSEVDKRLKANNDTIKSEMTNLGLDAFTAGDLVATLTTTVGENFNEEMALEILKEALTEEQKQQVIKTREYIDNDALEALIYSKAFDAGLLQNCITKGKPVVTLRISKAK